MWRPLAELTEHPITNIALTPTVKDSSSFATALTSWDPIFRLLHRGVLTASLLYTIIHVISYYCHSF